MMVTNHVQPEELSPQMRMLFAAGKWGGSVLPALARATISQDVDLLPQWLGARQQDTAGVCFRYGLNQCPGGSTSFRLELSPLENLLWCNTGSLFCMLTHACFPGCAAACRNLLLGDGGYIGVAREMLGGRKTAKTATNEPTAFDSKTWELFKRHAFRVRGVLGLTGSKTWLAASCDSHSTHSGRTSARGSRPVASMCALPAAAVPT